jgi:hypothetical protein
MFQQVTADYQPLADPLTRQAPNNGDVTYASALSAFLVERAARGRDVLVQQPVAAECSVFNPPLFGCCLHDVVAHFSPITPFTTFRRSEPGSQTGDEVTSRSLCCALLRYQVHMLQLMRRCVHVQQRSRRQSSVVAGTCLSRFSLSSARPNFWDALQRKRAAAFGCLSLLYNLQQSPQ